MKIWFEKFKLTSGLFEKRPKLYRFNLATFSAFNLASTNTIS